MNEWMNERTNERRNEWMNERTHERTNEGTSDQTNERTNEIIRTLTCITSHFQTIFCVGSENEETGTAIILLVD